MSWFSLFLHLFALGLWGAAVLVPFREIGKYYFRFHSTLALVLVAGAVLTGQPWSGFAAKTWLGKGSAVAALGFGAAVLLENALVRAAREGMRADALLLPLSVGVPFVAIAAFAATPYGTGEAVLLTLHLLTAAAVLGTSMVAMTTGHWYLSNATLSFDILVRLCRAFVGAVAAKGAVSGLYLATRIGHYGGLEAFDLLVMGVRGAAGVALALVLGLMSLSCARRRANQSATGILYVAVVFVLIGETISIYLTLGKGWPI